MVLVTSKTSAGRAAVGALSPGRRGGEWGVIGGNFGPSTRFTDARSVTDVIKTGLPLSLYLGVMAYVLVA